VISFHDFLAEVTKHYAWKKLDKGLETIAKHKRIVGRIGLSLIAPLAVLAVHFITKSDGKREESRAPKHDSVVAGPQAPEPLKLMIEKDTYKEGEDVFLTFTLPSEAYVYLFNISEDGAATLLIPNRDVTNNRFLGSTIHRIPDADWTAHDIALLACPDAGHAVSHATFRLVTSPRLLDIQLGHFAGPDFYTLQTGPTGTLAEILGAIKKEGNAIHEASAPYSVMAIDARTRCKPDAP
jgi:Domain of unknown function (DUF4384)